jgi:Ring finger domain
MSSTRGCDKLFNAYIRSWRHIFRIYPLGLSRADWLKFYDVSLGKVTHFMTPHPQHHKKTAPTEILRRRLVNMSSTLSGAVDMNTDTNPYDSAVLGMGFSSGSSHADHSASTAAPAGPPKGWASHDSTTLPPVDDRNDGLSPTALAMIILASTLLLLLFALQLFAALWKRYQKGSRPSPLPTTTTTVPTTRTVVTADERALPEIQRYRQIEQWLVNKRVLAHDPEIPCHWVGKQLLPVGSSGICTSLDELPSSRNAADGSDSGMPANLAADVSKGEQIMSAAAGRDRLSSGDTSPASLSICSGDSDSECENCTPGSWSHCETEDEIDFERQDEERECSICMESFEVNDIVSWSCHAGHCRHVFHHACIKEWLVKKQHCPICRNMFLPCDDFAPAYNKPKQLKQIKTILTARQTLEQMNRTSFYCQTHGVTSISAKPHANMMQHEHVCQLVRVSDSWQHQQIRGSGEISDRSSAEEPEPETALRVSCWSGLPLCRDQLSSPGRLPQSTRIRLLRRFGDESTPLYQELVDRRRRSKAATFDATGSSEVFNNAQGDETAFGGVEPSRAGPQEALPPEGGTVPPVAGDEEVES